MASAARKKIALTFDACTTRAPDPYDPRVTAVLEAMHVPATIFVGGGWAREEPAAMAELARDPLLEIGNHTTSHPHLTRLPDARIRDELLGAQREIAAVTGRVPTLFRPPYGEYDARVLRVAAAVGLTTIEYDSPPAIPTRARRGRRSSRGCSARPAPARSSSCTSTTRDSTRPRRSRRLSPACARVGSSS